MLHADIGKILMQSRTRTLDAAKARATMKGYKGAMFPWESAYSGKKERKKERKKKDEEKV